LQIRQTWYHEKRRDDCSLSFGKRRIECLAGHKAGLSPTAWDQTGENKNA